LRELCASQNDRGFVKVGLREGMKVRADDEDEQQGEKVVDSSELDSRRKVKDVDPASNARTQISIDRSESTLSNRTHHKTRAAGRDFDRTARKFDCSVC